MNEDLAVMKTITELQFINVLIKTLQTIALAQIPLAKFAVSYTVMDSIKMLKNNV